MKSLKFNLDFYQPIIEEVKIATSRVNDKGLSVDDEFEFVFMYENDSLISELSGLKGVVRKVETVRFDDLTNYHATLEGYLHKNLLKRELKRFYPNLNGDSIVYIYRFKLKN